MATLGNSPGKATQRIVTIKTATAGQTVFTPDNGYTLGYVDVVMNGSDLIVGDDFTANDGQTVTLTVGANAGDVVKMISWMPRGLSDGYLKSEADAKFVGKDSATGAAKMPVGTTAQRPLTPTSGMYRMNSTTGQPEWYDSAMGLWQTFATLNYPIDYLVIAGAGAGGRGGGSEAAGGGGAGGYLAGTTIANGGLTYAITVGAGGADSGSMSVNGGTGSSSILAGIATAIGGGGGVSGGGGTPTGTITGGSGGGGNGYSSRTGGSGTAGQGYAGGTGQNGSPYYPGGGGGGASAVGGSPANTSSIGVGGNGSTWLNGSSYAGGGGGGNWSSTNAAGGLGGGGYGGANGGNGGSGTINTGSGGGGGTQGSLAGAGGSGVVIIRYAGSQRASGGTITQSGGYTYHTFTSSGTFTA